MTLWPPQARHWPLGLVLLVAACGTDTPHAVDEATTAAPTTETVTAEGTADSTASSVSEGLTALPVREGPRRQTTGSVPHIQTDAVPVPDVDAELRRRVFSMPGIDEGDSSLSLPGARSLLLSAELELARPEVLPGGQEFGHFHPDGSLHLWLPVERAVEVHQKKWGELHPLVERDNFWDGVVMIYVPETTAEADIALQLVADAYNYIVGAELDPTTSD